MLYHPCKSFSCKNINYCGSYNHFSRSTLAGVLRAQSVTLEFHNSYTIDLNRLKFVRDDCRSSINRENKFHEKITIIVRVTIILVKVP